MTCDDSICEDIHKVFQQLTGMGEVMRVKKLFHAPFTLHKRLIQLIDREREHAEAGNKALIRLKANGLTEPKLIRALYRASQAGVRIELVIRGMCSLRPGIPGVSENIEVRSIIGRFLEHTRVYYFLNGGNDEIYAASADLMERNLLRRVETAFPIEANKLKERMKAELEIYTKDNTQAWILQTDGSYVRVQPGPEDEPISAQSWLLDNLAASTGTSQA
jgi:polyphosphate kinase